MLLTLTIGAAPAFAADTDPIAIKWAANGIDVTLTHEDRVALDKTVGPFTYVETNTAGTWRYSQTPPTGITVADLLEAAGIDTSTLEPDRIILFRAGDNPNMTAEFTWGQLTEERYTYTYPAGTGNQAQLRQGVKGAQVPSILGFNQGSASPRNFMGLTYPEEQFRGVMIQQIASIEIGGLAGTWVTPQVYTENTSIPDSGTPISNGATVEAGMKLRISSSLGQGGTSMKYFYTTNGNDPVPGNPDTYVFNWNSNGPSIAANPSIIVPEGSGQFVVKAITYGYGMLTSEVATYTFNYPLAENSAFLTGPDEVNIDETDEIEYTVNVAKVADINAFTLKMSYDAAKLTYKDADVQLPSGLNGWVLDTKNDATAGILELTIMTGAKGQVLTTENAAELVGLQFTLKSGVAEDDVIEADLLSVKLYDPIAPAKYDATIAGDGVSTLVVVNEIDPLLKYDINGDGVFDLLDLAIIIYRYFQVASGEALWSEAQVYDIMENGVIDTADIIALYSLIEG